MSRFYEHLYHGVSASESLHQAMKWMRENGFAKVSEWAPFMLIGDNVTFDFGSKSKYKHFTLVQEWTATKPTWATWGQTVSICSFKRDLVYYKNDL